MKLSAKTILLCISFLAVAGGITSGVYEYMKSTGYWSEANLAIRELKRQEIPLSPEQALKAVRASDLKTLKLLDAAGLDFNSKLGVDENGDSLLHYAAKKLDWGTVNALLDYGASVDIPDAQGRTVTSVIMEAGNLSLARKLLDGGAKADFIHSTGEPALIQNLRDNNVGNVLTLINAGADVNVRAKNGENALYVAWKRSLYEPVIVLLSAGADPNSMTPAGVNLLSQMCQTLPDSTFSEADTKTIIQSLINHEADLSATTNNGWRPLQWCVHYGKLDLIQNILSKDKDVSNTLWIAFSNKDYGIAMLLLENGADAEQLGPDGVSPLMAMIREDYPAMITKLLDHGVDPDQLGEEGQSALMTAIAMGRTDAAIALLAHPTRPAQHSGVLRTPVEKPFYELFGSDPKFGWYTRNAPGLTTLMVAIMKDDLKVAEQLIKNGASRTQGTKNRYPVYPIQMSAERGNVQMQQLLIGVPYQDDQQVRNFVIDLSEQKVRYYKHGKLIKTAKISSGRRGYRTKTGKFVITDKTRDKRSNIYDNSPMPYFQRFSCSAIGFHEGNIYSRFASHGCIRLSMSTAKFFWKEAKPGDRVEIVK